MIVIIADDFSGVAELAGIAAVRGLKTELQTVFDPSSEAEVIAVDTNTRTKTERESELIVHSVSRAIFAAHPDWIFKNQGSTGHRPRMQVAAPSHSLGMRKRSTRLFRESAM